MPRAANVPSTSSFEAKQLLATLQKEIRSRDAHLRRLKEEETILSGLIDRRRTAVGRTLQKSTGAVRRINWGNVLKQMPKQFKLRAIRKLRGLKDKRSPELFAAVTRCMEARVVKRKERGLYERVQPSQPRQPRKPKRTA